ncbi:MAG: radical SAM protein [Methanococci archaeon]|nr:radical SAM protein [Methanococci archaeon]
MSNIAFGVVPSRRLGKSLGINNIPCKFCSYDCIYCQVGRTINKTIERRNFYNPYDIFSSVKEKINKIISENGKNSIDYLTFVADGEPTLDINITKEVDLLREFDIPIAIISNSSLIWREDVKNDLLNFDLVSLKIDSADCSLWKRINRPHKKLSLETILNGILEFRDDYRGKLITETMIVDMQYPEEAIEKTAEFLKEVNPDKCYINTPIRPPSEEITPPKKEILLKVIEVFTEIIGKGKVIPLKTFEGSEFIISTTNVEEEILAITSVHPIREKVIKELLTKQNITYETIEKMVKEGKLIKLNHCGEVFYMKNIKSRKNKPGGQNDR